MLVYEYKIDTLAVAVFSVPIGDQTTFRVMLGRIRPKPSAHVAEDRFNVEVNRFVNKRAAISLAREVAQQIIGEGGITFTEETPV